MLKKVATIDCHLCPKVKDATPKTVVISCPARQPLLRYLKPLSDAHRMSKRINYAMNVFLLSTQAPNNPKIVKKVKGQKTLEKGQSITIRIHHVAVRVLHI